MKKPPSFWLLLAMVFIGVLSLHAQEKSAVEKTPTWNLPAAPLEPFAVSVVATGPYRAPAMVELVANVTHPATTTISKVEFYNGEALLGTVTTPPYEFAYEEVGQGKYRIEAKAYDAEGTATSATTEFEVVLCNRYNRGFGTDQMALSSMIALDNEQGICLDGINDFSTLYGKEGKNYPWFLRATYSSEAPCNHLLYEESTQSISYAMVNSLPTLEGKVIGGQPPFVAFGSQGGGTPLYINQDYHFGIAAGGQDLTSVGNIDLQVEVYDKDNFTNGSVNVPRVAVAKYSLPRYDPFNPYALIGIPSSQNWKNFTENGSIQTYQLLETNNNKLIDFETSIQYAPLAWGQNFIFPLLITHRAGNNDFYYKVSIRGLSIINGQAYPLAIGSTSTNGACNLSYTLDFETPPAWSEIYLSEPHFQGSPLPSSYEGKSVDELIHQAPAVEDSLRTSQEMGLELTKLNNSPELKSHTALDQFAQLLGNDPLRIANYVQNQIALTDTVGYNTGGGPQDISFNSQGVTRDALATYLEGQGSPIEQCSLLIYLLRKAGIPAAYIFPEHNQTLLFDQQLSRLLRVQLRGAQTALGQTYLPELIPVNYPWVTAYIEGKWVHLFPWIKDTEISEGEAIWNYFPEGYKTERQWLLHYLFNDPTIRGLSEHGEEDNAGGLFKKYAQVQLEKVGKGLEQVGIQYHNRIHDYSKWEDFPRPWQTPLITERNLAQNLDAAQNPNLSEELTDIFDTISIQILSDSNGNGQVEPGKPLLETGPLRFVDLHDRQLLLYHQLIAGSNPTKYTMALALEPYDLNESAQSPCHSFTKGESPDVGNLRAAQCISTQLQTSSTAGENDDLLLYKITMNNHQKANDVETKPIGQLPGIGETRKMELTRTLRKGDMAVLSLNYGKVSQRMINFEIEKYHVYQERPTIPPELTGQMLQVMGKVYYEKVSDMGEELENLLKVRTLSWKACGLSKLSPERDQAGNPVLTAAGDDFNLVYPRVDMYYSKTAVLGNQSSHLESGESGERAQELTELLLADGSAQEHRVINELFDQKGAISTIKLLDLAQGWTPETGVAATPGKNIILLTPHNAIEEGKKNYTATGPRKTSKPLSEWAKLYSKLWKSITDNFFTGDIDGPTQRVPFDKLLNIAIVNQAPVTALGQEGKPYTGMGALIFNSESTGALISDTKEINNGGYGGSTTPISASSPEREGNIAFNEWMKKMRENQSWEQFNKQLNAGTSNSLPETPSVEKNNPENKDPDTKDIPSIGSTIPSAPPSQPTQLPPARIEQLKQESAEKGLMGLPSYYGKLLNFVHDPVSVVTGEFYINALDLELKGPMPLELRRTYSSQNLAENNLGSGWKMGAFHYLMLSADGNESTPPSLIYAAESDGSVVAYRYQKEQNTWIPQPGDNPNLINANDGTLQPSHNLIPPSRNLFNNRITKTTSSTQSTSNSIETYTLSASDGSTRTFTVRSFPLSNTPDITRTRPYLDTWQDPQGNSLSFAYGTNNKASSWGELTSIIASNGNTLHFSYDAQGHITEAFGSDGRHLTYQYDNFGDLIKVTLPDNSVVAYQYAHTTTSGKTTSTHLLTQQTKPGGRILKNDYDAQRRVIAQYASGSSPKPSLSATFDYNSTGSNGVISGNSTVTDALGNRTDYLYDNNQITNILYPANGSGIRPSISRQWTSGGTYKAMAQETNRQGLSKNYRYDGAGNLTSLSESGTLTGESSGGNETATTTFTYNTNNLLTSVTDPLGNKTIYEYSGYNLTSIRQTALGKIRSTQLTYQENQGAHGLLSSINKGGATTTFTYNSKGFLTSRTEQTGTQDPALTETISCDGRGNIIQSINSLGEKKTYDYDMMDRPIFEETFDATGSPIDWHSCYYNGNGEITWEQGARFNPVNYTTLEYDWSGKVTHKGTWQSKALPDGSGITSAGIAATSYGYDGQGNMTSMTDPNGNVISMTYDANGNMLSRSKGGATETFSYDTGGNITAHTTLLGGTEQNSITSRGQVASITAANGTTTSYRYDLIGRLTQTIFPNGTQEKIAYDDGANKRTTTLCDNNGTTLSTKTETFDNQGNCISWTDEAGNLFQASYDGLGRIVTFQGPPGGPSSAQQTKTYHYGINSTTSVNALGEWKTTYVDALKRPLATFAFNSDGSLALKESRWYSADHQSVTTWQGEGNATSVTTDLQGHPLIISNADGSCKVMTYDANGNPTSTTDEEGNVTTFTYDALNHLTSQTLPGGGMIAYSYNPLGELLSRSLPGGVTEKNDYNEAGEKIADAIVGSDGSTTAHHTYSYTQGRISSVNDHRGFTTTLGYDGVGRTVSVISNGSPTSAQNQRSAYTYDPRGLLSSVAQYYADPSTGPSTLVSRAYDAYGQLISESTSLNGAPHSSWKQSWDGRGRRVALNWTLDNQSPVAQYSFNYNALGLMTQAGNGSGTCSYGYGQDGLLLSRSTPFGTTTMTRDHCGRVLQQKLSTGAQESLSWRGDGRLSSYSMADPSGALISETRNYSYDGRGRVTQEPFTSMEKGTQMAGYEFDPLNVRMKQEVDSSIATAVVAQNGFSQVTRDSLPTETDPGRLLNSYYDEAGETINRLIPGETQGLIWDSFGRLVKVSNRDSKNQGYDWNTIYDGLGRRLQTAYNDATGDKATSAPLTLRYYYDPEVEFLEIGHELYGRTWNLFGPDRSGFYGGAQGIGGMETIYQEQGQVTCGILKNFFGDHLGNLNSLGLYAWDVVVGGYGALPGFSVNGDLVPQWRGHYLDWIGFYYMGARYYDPNNGRFLSADPFGHDTSLSLYDYCDGDPVNGLDPDGRCVENAHEAGLLNDTEYQNANYILQKMNNPNLNLSTLLWTIGGMELAYVDQDLNDATFLKSRDQALQRLPNEEQVMSVNGIFTKPTQAQVNANKIAESMHLQEDDVLRINNYTHHWRDLMRASFEQFGFIDIRSLCLADTVNFNNGGNITAYSNGSVVVANAAPYMTASAKAHLTYTGLNPQRYIGEEELGFKRVINARNKWDVVSLLFPSNRFQKWEKTLTTDNYFFDVLGNHSFKNNYPVLMHQ